MSDHDLDLVTDRYLRRFDPFVPPFGEAWPRDTFHWADTRRRIATLRASHGFRNAGLSLDRFSRLTRETTEWVRRLGKSLQ